MTSQIEFENLVKKHVDECTRCDYFINGKAFPWFGSNPKLIIIGEAPHTEEIAQGTFFVGKSGQLLFNTLQNECKIERNDTIILNSVFCMPTTQNGKKIGKPKKDNIELCFVHSTNLLYKIKQIYNINSILVLGGYARYIFKKTFDGIMKDCGKTENLIFKRDNSSMKLHYCIHPSSCFYNGKNLEIFKKTLHNFFGNNT